MAGSSSVSSVRSAERWPSVRAAGGFALVAERFTADFKIVAGGAT